MSCVLGLKVRHQLRLCRFFECNSLKMDIGFGGPAFPDELRRAFNLGCCDGAKGVSNDILHSLIERSHGNLLRGHFEFLIVLWLERDGKRNVLNRK